MQAVWNGVVVAESQDTVAAESQDTVVVESQDTVVVEGNHYFPRDSLRDEFFVTSDHHSTCPWKGEASYLSLEVDGKKNRDAAWFYPSPSPAARQITGRVAFWRGVQVRPAAAPGDEHDSGAQRGRGALGWLRGAGR